MTAVDRLEGHRMVLPRRPLLWRQPVPVAFRPLRRPVPVRP